MPVTTLDDFFAGRSLQPNFLKIDVEGHELAVLQGARQTLKKHRPTILVECEARHRPDGDVRPVFEFLQSLGYGGSFFRRTARGNRWRRSIRPCTNELTRRIPTAFPRVT